MVGPAHRLGAVQLAQRPVKGPDGDAIGLGRTGDDLGATGVAWGQQRQPSAKIDQRLSRRSLRPVSHRSEEHTSALQSLMRISYAVFCLNKKNNEPRIDINTDTTV